MSKYLLGAHGITDNSETGRAGDCAGSTTASEQRAESAVRHRRRMEGLLQRNWTAGQRHHCGGGKEPSNQVEIPHTWPKGLSKNRDLCGRKVLAPHLLQEGSPSL